ncbi:PA2778 family cysteine peptidase [Desulfopila inferna]|uniref:PA2778 family cysteine peptidase n=1 Tax=Desulfopila inferna TaxID=468528 RepID=UPI001964D0A7|nr:PA2778 family cysteine peptidase [Desulfopila inferna]MBM9603655.1 PA2778 family cysteine peptidase [Desulfopila inferna]
MYLSTIARAGLLCLLLWQLSGCSLKYQPVDLGGSDYPDLEATPFFPQEKYQCGPASLAMVLAASGVNIRPEQLTPLLYVPERQGSFQLELVAASRSFGRIPYVIDPNLDALAAELVVGRPVLVLQNYGLDFLPFYHYAVAIGLQPDEKIILRSGTTKRLIMALPSFLVSWQRPGSWALVILRPGELPAKVDRDRYLQALAAFEKTASAVEALPAYRAALHRWPDDGMLLFASGNNALMRNSQAEAEDYFRQALERDGQHLGAMNNLADTLARRGCLREAKEIIERAATLAEKKDSVFSELIALTQKEIRHLAETPENSAAPVCR